MERDRVGDTTCITITSKYMGGSKYYRKLWKLFAGVLKQTANSGQ